MSIDHSSVRRDGVVVRSTLWIWLLCLICWAPSLHAADALGAKRMPLPEEAPKVEAQDKRPLTEFLDADGRLVIPEGFSGSLDPAGLSLVSKPGEPPRFAAKNAVDDPARWDPQFGQGIGCDGQVQALAVFSDGKIVIGGSFLVCGNVFVNRVAIWNPVTGVFESLGTGAANGVSDVGFRSVDTLAIAGSDVYVGGNFTQAGGATANYVARFNTSTQTWSSLGTGAANGVDGFVTTLTIAGSDVYVGGSFTQAGGAAANYVARFNTSTQTWSSLGTGAANGVSGGFPPQVRAISIADSNVYVGGFFTQAGGVVANGVARFNTSTQSWSSLGTGAANGVSGIVYALAIAGSDVYVGGAFTQAGGAAANNIARFNTSTQTWLVLGSGAVNGVASSVFALSIEGSDVYVGGTFLQAGDVSANYVALFSSVDQAWSALGGAESNGVMGFVFALTIAGSDLYVGGSIRGGGSVTSNGVVRFRSDAQVWSPLGNGASNGSNGGVFALASMDTDIYAGGEFTEIGGIVASRVARFSRGTQKWSALGVGALNGVSGGGFIVNALAVVGADVYVGGLFSQAGDQSVRNVARFNAVTQSWSSLGSGIDNGVNGRVSALAISGSGAEIYVGGFFTEAGGIAANRVARFNTSTQTWSSLGTGAANGVNDRVNALAITGTDVYVGGRFTAAGGTSANRVARFNTSTQTWSSLGTGAANGVNDRVNALAITGTDVYVGGFFTQAGATVASNVARFNTSSGNWFPLGAAPSNGVDGVVYDLAILGGDVVAAGDFIQAAGVAANRVARFSSSKFSWSVLGGSSGNGVNNRVESLLTEGSNLYLGGIFSSAGPNVGLRIARYDARRNTNSTISASPTGSTVTANTPITFTGTIAVTSFTGQPGAVDFLDSGVMIPGCANRPLVGGLDTRTATCATSSLRVGTHSVVARYQGDALNFIGTSDPFVLTVNAPALSISPASLPTAFVGANYNQTLSLSGSGSVAPITLAVTSGSLPTGLTLLPNGQLSGVPSASGSFEFTVTGTDSSTTSATGGPFSASRVYSLPVTRQTSSVSLTRDVGPSVVVNNTINYTANVTAPSFSGSPGTVAFRDGTTPIVGCGNVVLVGGGTTRSATCTTNALPVGVRNLTAVYTGDAFNEGSTSGALSQTVTAPSFTFTPSGPGLPAGTFGVAGYQAGPISVTTGPTTGVQAPVSYQVLPSPAALPPGLSPSVSGGLLISGTPTAAGTYAFTVRTTDNSAVGVGGPFSSERSYSIVIEKRTQTITFDALPDRPLSAASFAVTASATSGLAVSFASQTASTCTVSGTTVTLVSAGVCTIRASQAGDANWVPAPSVDRSFTVLASAGVVLSSSGSPSVVNTPVTLTATITGVNPTGTVAFREEGVEIPTCGAQVLAETGNTRTATCLTSTLRQGLRSLTAVYTGDANNAGGTSNTLTQNVQSPVFVITPAGATLPSGTVGVAYGPVTLAASGTGTVPPFSYFASSALPPGLSLNETTGVLSGTPTEGGTFPVSIVARDSSSAAVGGPFNSPIRSYNVTMRRTQTITFDALPDRPLSAGSFTVTASATSGLAVSFASQTPTTCTVSGTTVTLVSAGLCTIRASQAGDANWVPAPSVDRSFTVLASAGVVLSSSGSPSVVNTPVTLTATITGVNPTGTVAFREEGVEIPTCGAQTLTGTGNTRTATCLTSTLRQGLRSLTAVYTGDANNAGGTSNTLTQNVQSPVFVITPAGATLPSGTVGVAYGPVTLAASGTGTVPPFVYFASSALPPGLSLNETTGVLSGTPTEGGTFPVSIVARDSSSAAVGGPFNSPIRSYNVTMRRTQTITFDALPDRPLSAGSFTVTASATSGLAVSFASQTASTCTVSGTTVTLVSAGVCTIRASQAGDANWMAAPPVDRSFTVLASAGVVLSSSGSPSVVNTPVTLTATITGVNPTGTVAFREEGLEIPACGTQALTGTGNTRAATCTTSSLRQGLRRLTAAYTGDTNNAAGTSNQFTQNVQFPVFVITPAGLTLPTGAVGVAYGPVTFAASGTGTVPPFTYFASSALPAGLTLNESTGVLSGTPTEGGTFPVSIVVQDSSSKAVGGPFSSAQRSYSVTITPNVAPNLTYTPSTGTPVTLAGLGSLVGDPATGSVSILVSGGSGAGNATLGCNVTGGNFTLQGSPVGAINPGSTPVPIAVRCTRTAAVQNGSLSCTETSNPPGSQQSRSWPLVCPAASAISPTLSYVPAPGNTVVFPAGGIDQLVNETIAVSSTGGIGAASTNLNCAFQGGAASSFFFTGGNSQTLTVGQTAVNLGLQCRVGPLQRGTTLRCTELDSPSGANRVREWDLRCPAAIASGVVSVGRRVAIRGQEVMVPVRFTGDGSTVSMSAQFRFDPLALTPVWVRGASGATCALQAGSVIQVQRPVGGLLPSATTTYCEVKFRVLATAPMGASALVIEGSSCLDQGGQPRLCTQQDGRVGVAGLNPLPADGSTMVMAGYASTQSQSRSLRVENRGPLPLSVSSCAITPASANLEITSPVAGGFPLTLGSNAAGSVTVRCVLPPVGQERVAELACTTTDPMRSVMRYPLSCLTVADGQPLPTQRWLDAELRAGEEAGSSVARGATPDGVVTAVGAPLGGSSGDGRVLLYGEAANLTQGDALTGLLASVEASDSGSALRGTGATPSARLGQSVALRSDGQQLAVGAPFGGPGRPGRVYLFDRPANGWLSFDSLTATPIELPAPTLAGGSTAEFGQSVAYTPNGDLVVGAPGSAVGGVTAGAVFVYARTGNTLGAPALVSSPGASSTGRFGASVAARGNLLAVGAPGEFTGVAPNQIRTGAAYVVPIQNGAPTGPAVRITPTGALQANDRFGSAVATTNSLLVIGASGSDTSEGTDSGSAYLFRPGTSASGWVGAAQLLPATGSGAGQELGTSVALSSDLILVGAPKADVGGVVDRGRVYGYAVKASYAATERPTSTLENAGGRANDEFGRSVVVGLGATVVGVPQADVSLIDNTLLNDVGRADGFLLEKLFADGFE